MTSIEKCANGHNWVEVTQSVSTTNSERIIPKKVIQCSKCGVIKNPYHHP